METYISFRVNRICLAEYIDVTEALIHKLPGPEVSFARDLMRTYVAIISGRDKLAEELLGDFARDEAILKRKSVLEYCAYLYLKALQLKNEEVIASSTDIIRKYYENGHCDWRILWFLLYTDKRYEKNRGLKLADIKEQFDMGCRSPILYYEAVSIFNEEPYLLRELSVFEIQAFNFGIRNWIISREAAKQYTYIAAKRKTFDQVIFKGLVKLYDEFDNNEILAAICSMLIKGMKRSKKYYEWYRLGVEAQLRITELYEYYMYSVSDTMQDKLPQSVLMYFMYNSTLNESRKAFLFAGVVKSKDINGSIYNSYYKKLEIYALKMLEEHSISHDLAVLYREILSEPVLNTEIYKQLPYVMYKHELICNNPGMVSVTVIHKEMGAEENIPLVDGKAIVDIYTDNSEIFLIDGYGNRYVDPSKYQLTPFMNAEEYESKCMEYSNHPMLLLHSFERIHSYRVLSSSAIELRRRVLQIEGLSEEYSSYCHQTLIEYYYENMNDELLEYYLEQLDLSRVPVQERIKYIEIMLIRTFYRKALEALEAYGYDEMPINRLVRLCSVWTRSSAAEKKAEHMVELCFYVFSHEKYDEAILRYLINFYDGTIMDMYKLWQAAQGFELECHNLEERLLSQMLFTESYLENSFSVFHTYYKAITNHLLVRAFLTYYAYRYLIFDQLLDPGLFLIMKRELFYEENDFCLLAWLKYHATEGKLSESELTFAEYNIHRLVKRGIVLPFFLGYGKLVSLPDGIADKYVVSWFAAPGKRIFIHYRLDDGKDSEFVTERMHNCFRGIYTKEFLLFWHEELEYYITEEAADISKATDVIRLRYECEIPLSAGSNYSHINLMLKAMEMKDNNTLLDLAEEYAEKQYMISQCFQPIHRNERKV
jgi:hypothetical protein